MPGPSATMPCPNCGEDVLISQLRQSVCTHCHAVILYSREGVVTPPNPTKNSTKY